MAITKFQRWKINEKNSDDLTKESEGIFDRPVYEDESLAVRQLYDKVHELTDLINTHITKMATNDAKSTFPGFGTNNSTALRGDTTVISSSQASAIVANTAKTSFPGLGTTNKTALAGDTTTITTTQAKAITNNTTNIDSKLDRRIGKDQSLVCLIEEDKNGDHSLIFQLSIKDEKTGKTVRKSATLQLK